MTIKEFAGLCKCGTQTLRYYDKIGLLKPVQVDPWSGYRYYEAAQAIDFVKIKNLQSAGFTIDEIKVLLTKTDQQVSDAFSVKIAKQEQKLRRMIEIQQSYLQEKNSMEQAIQAMAAFITGHLRNYEGLREFGLDPRDGEMIAARLQAYLAQWMWEDLPEDSEVCLRVNEEVYRGEENVAKKISGLKEENWKDTILLGGEDAITGQEPDPSEYETLLEKHGWEHPYQFLDQVPRLEAGAEYNFLFRLNQEQNRVEGAYPLLMLSAMLVKNEGTKVRMGCSVEKSSDGQNHFVMLRRK